jgi:phage terminase small subunit
MPNPYILIINKAHEMMLKFWTEFGLTAASRTRIRIERPKQLDEFEMYQNRRKRA